MLKTKVLEFNEYKIDRNWLYAPSTYLVDSFEPFVEEIYLPEVSTKSGQLILSLKENSEAIFLQRKSKIKQFKKINKITTLIDLLESPDGQDKLEKELDFFIRTNKKQHIKRFLGALK